MDSPTPSVGKQVGDSLYIHLSLVPELPRELRQRLRRAADLAEREPGKDFNVVRFATRDEHSLSLLHYENLEQEPFPVLQQSWAVNLAEASVSPRDYRHADNPPILHRKELLLPADHPRHEEFSRLTADLESANLFMDAAYIGTRQRWEARLAESGYALEGHRLVRLEDSPGEPGQVARHRTAISRAGPSAPIQALARHGYLDGRYTVLDYGCGRGDDLRHLLAHGVEARGWDPYYAPDTPLEPADVVNLGFVVNVIEDPQERVHTVQRAFELSRRVLAVAVMLNRPSSEHGQALGDGVLTRWQTFQKYFSQRELRSFLEECLEHRAVAMGPGIYFVFKDELEEQRFASERQRNRVGLSRSLARLPRPSPEAQQQARYEQYQRMLEPLWERLLDLGREPDESEVDYPEALSVAFGSVRKAVSFLMGVKGTAALKAAAKARQEDLRVYFALQVFEQRQPYAELPPGLQRDVKAFFGSYQNAREEGTQWLYQVADTHTMVKACLEAGEAGLGHWDGDQQQLQLLSRMIPALPPILRIFVGCAALLYGDVASADLVKIHAGSSKLSLMRYEDFDHVPLPRLLERIKIDLRAQAIHFFEHPDPERQPYLFNKSLYLPEDDPQRAIQQAFDARLAELVDLSGHGPSPAAFEAALKRHRWEVQGFSLVRAGGIPDLDDPCGEYLRYRDLIECGETQGATGLANVPQRPETYAALTDLVTQVLDPVMDYFGSIQLTFGFCSAELAKAIGQGVKRIEPKLDQHASHERHKNGRIICPRLGAAVDFIIPDESMREVAQWIVANTPFDRLYYYGDDRPLHVSVGPEQKREVVLMRENTQGRRIPRVLREGQEWPK